MVNRQNFLQPSKFLFACYINQAFDLNIVLKIENSIP